MKFYLQYFVFFLFLVSCGSNAEDNSVEGKKKTLEKYKKELADLQSKIQVLETELASQSGEKDLKLVETLPLVAQTFEHFIEVQGNVESEQNVLVQPEMSGTIIKKFVEEGQDIAKGQPIAELDVEPLKRQIEELEKRIELAQTYFERQSNLWNQKIGTEIQYLQAKNSLESLQKSLEVLKANKDKAVVRAPISGTVDNFLANVGEMANPAMPFCRIVNLASVKIEAEVSETYIKSVKKGDLVKVSFPNLNLEMPVKIEQIGQFINPQNRTFKIKMGINNQDRNLRPNSMAVVKIKNFDKGNSVVVPTQVIQQTTEGKSFLFVVRQENGKNIIKKLNITTGMSYQGNTLIEEGLQAGDVVVIKGYNEVIDGEEVGVVKNS